MLVFPVEHFKAVEQQHTHYLRSTVVRYFKVSELYKSSCVCTHHEGISRSGSTVPLIITLGFIWKLVVTFVLLPLYSHKKSLYPVNRRLGGLQSRSGRFGENKNPAA
jgi:hypothetical protein